MATTNTWDQIVTKITGVVNRGTLNWSGSNTTYVLSSGYYTGGTLDSRPSYNNGYSTGVSAADNRVNTSSASYSSGYNNGYNAGRTSVSIQQRTGTVTSYIPSAGNRYVSIPLSGSPIAMVVNYSTVILYCMVNGVWWRCQNRCQSISSPVVSQSSSAMVINTSTNTTHDWNYRYIYKA